MLDVVVILNKGSIHSATGSAAAAAAAAASATGTTVAHATANNGIGLSSNGGSATSGVALIGCDAIELKLREEFAKTCFETLLQFSLLDDDELMATPAGANNNNGIGGSATTVGSQATEGGVAGRLAVTALLHRFQEVLKKFNDDERQAGKCPLPRYRLSEISFVLKAVATLIVSMKKAPPAKGEQRFCFVQNPFVFFLPIAISFRHINTQLARPPGSS